MSLDRTFIALSSQQVADLIMQARTRVIYAAPSLSLDVASALINTHTRLEGNVAVLLDVSESVFRLGYGVVEAVSDLRAHGVAVREAEGLRIGIVVADDRGFIFTQPPLLVEANRSGDAYPNAIRASSDQIAKLVEAVLPPPAQRSLLPEATNQSGAPKQSSAIEAAEIGQKLAPSVKIETVEAAIKQNPPDNFDLARVVQVFSAHIQFYEFEVRGAQVQNQTVQLPKTLLASIGDQATRERITAAFKLVAADSKVSGSKIRERAADIRKTFIRHHPVYGGVILKSARIALEQEIAALEEMIEEHKKLVLNRFNQDASKSIEELVKAFWRDIVRNPPKDLLYQLGTGKPSTDEAKDYLRFVLTAAFPKAEDVAQGMKVTRVVKDVTWSTLNNDDFIDWLKEQFPLRKDLQQPFDLYRAAKEATAKAPSRA